MKRIYIELKHPALDGSRYLIFCPYCRHGWKSTWKEQLCPSCNGIFSEELARKLSRLSRALK